MVNNKKKVVFSLSRFTKNASCNVSLARAFFFAAVLFVFFTSLVFAVQPYGGSVYGVGAYGEGPGTASGSSGSASSGGNVPSINNATTDNTSVNGANGTSGGTGETAVNGDEGATASTGETPGAGEVGSGTGTAASGSSQSLSTVFGNLQLPGGVSPLIAGIAILIVIGVLAFLFLRH